MAFKVVIIAIELMFLGDSESGQKHIFARERLLLYSNFVLDRDLVNNPRAQYPKQSSCATSSASNNFYFGPNIDPKKSYWTLMT